MGTTYQVIMFDEYDWDYADSKKQHTIDKINDFLLSQGYGGQVETNFYKAIVLDVGKQFIYDKELNNFILNNCDCAFYNTNTDIVLQRLEPCNDE